MRKLSIFISFIFTCSIVFSQVNTQKSFHDTQGSIEVNGSGQLQFSLPVALPPAVKSVAPQINLVYTSGSGNGIAGYGWNLSGITAISRVGKNLDKDGKGSMMHHITPQTHLKPRIYDNGSQIWMCIRE